ncbi:PREDICTED: soluble calcium-activated nucleotidase 1 [Dufourea novaeangliae]|uniref:Apyrase n=1 Tax=Dufourea novaeangliae TaxID=178035 RepID=A0A154P5Y0_DUFNO|nr:PREDICTED: soluble calcium-activated nucleotidase 1 [Dufourea novaeangliae]KZC07277.1 Soluble calcium-activated nucleotidase 1 [Dufourea novaeangliae]
MQNGNIEKMSYLHDWRQALRVPHVYRVANSTFRIQSQYLALIFLLLSVPVFLLGFPLLRGSVRPSSSNQFLNECRYYKYNKTYPLSPPLRTSKGVTYRIAIVSDLDHDSKSLDKKNTWHSIMKTGSLFWDRSTNFISIIWDDRNQTLTSSLTMKGRGMELSELVTFDGHLLSFDDRTGVIYAIEGEEAYPWVILMDGNGKNSKGFKTEWATVKDEYLYVGSTGKEWTTPLGEFQHNNPLWVKVISPRGEIHSLNWMSNYKRLRQALNIEYPGYMIHESGDWSDVHKRWFFLPRRCSHERYVDTKDETLSCNVLLTADENFVDIKVTEIGKLNPLRGFSTFKFLPGSEDSIIVALKTEEYLGQTATYILAFTIEGVIIMPEVRLVDKKFEGLEFI